MKNDASPSRTRISKIRRAHLFLTSCDGRVTASVARTSIARPLLLESANWIAIAVAASRGDPEAADYSMTQQSASATCCGGKPGEEAGLVDLSIVIHRLLASQDGFSRLTSFRTCALGLLLIAGVSGCGLLPRRAGVSPNAGIEVKTSVCPGTRYRIGDLGSLVADAKSSIERERASISRSGGSTGHLPEANYLAISGGGDSGAFAAGVLVGWTKEGSRPKFKVVTGISAGALIAPFAFLGSGYDDVLRDVSTSIGPKDIFHVRNILAAISSDAFADDTPLASLIAKYIDADLLSAIAQQYDKGRVLLIGTTDLDSRQPVQWNMGAIASCKDPRALDLFRQVILASAAIPGLFPPVMIDVEADGKRYQEMHVDGGVTNQVFLFPQAFVFHLTAGSSDSKRARHAYVIRNGHICPQWQSVPRRSTEVARRALNTLIETQGVNDLYRLQVMARSDDESFDVAYIGSDFVYPHKKMFATDYLRKLFDYSFQSASAGAIWHTALPEDNVRPDTVVR